MKVKVWMTATAVTFHSDADSDYSESHGWVDAPHFHELMESRNYVSPVAEWDDTDEDDTDEHATVADFIRATVAEYLGSAEDNGDGTHYGNDAHGAMCNGCLTDGRTISYALHFTHKRYDARRGWVEDDVTADYVSPWPHVRGVSTAGHGSRDY